CFIVKNTATSQTYTLSLHDALPIFSERSGEYEQRRDHLGDLQFSPSNPARVEIDLLRRRRRRSTRIPSPATPSPTSMEPAERQQDRKSTRLNSSHVAISYAVFCLKK